MQDNLFPKGFPMRPSHSRHGFTLVELLVVIAVIGILMAITVPGAGSVMKSMRKTSARADANIVKTILADYHASYNGWPAWDGAKDALSGGTAETDALWVRIMRCDTDDERVTGTYRAHNRRLISFWSCDTNKLVGGAFCDPWGHPYQYRIDADGDGTIKAPNDDDRVSAEIIVWSMGPDGETDDNDRGDDVRIWTSKKDN